METEEARALSREELELVAPILPHSLVDVQPSRRPAPRWPAMLHHGGGTDGSTADDRGFSRG